MPAAVYRWGLCPCCPGVGRWLSGVNTDQALVCLSNREIVDASRGCTFHCNMANNRLITVFFL